MDDSKYKKKIQGLARSLNNYDQFSVVEAWLENLTSKTDKKDLDLFKRLPWVQFFLLKIALLSKSGPIRMSKTQFSIYANKLYSLQVDAAHGLQPEEVELVLRPMIVQQIWYQQKSEHILTTLFRQRVLFLGANPWYAEQFHRHTAVTLSSFYIISLYLIIRSRGHSHTALDINLYELLFNLSPAISFDEVIKYFLLLGVRTIDIQKFIRHYRLPDIFESEYFQDTPLKERPIIINGDSLIISDLHMFNAALKDFAPDLLKKVPGYKNQFGPDFEMYLSEILKASDLEFWDEKNKIAQIYRKYGITGKVVDFLIPHTDSVVLIESKAIEPNAIVKTASDALLLKRMLCDSFIKAIKQGVHAASALGRTEELSGKHFSLLVVTHGDFGIFGGRWVSEYIDKDLANWIFTNHPDSPLSLDDIFYCTVDDFENLIRGHSAGACDLFALVREASTKNETKAGKKFVFQQVISSNLKGSIGLHTSLKESMDEYLSLTLKSFRENRDWWKTDVGKLIATRRRMVDIFNSVAWSPSAHDI